MIVLSIMTALAIEQIALSLHNRQTAHASRDRIERELGADREALQQSLTQNEADAGAMKLVLKQLLPLLQAAKPDDAIILALVHNAFKRVDIVQPTWQIYTRARDGADSLNFITGGSWDATVTGEFLLSFPGMRLGLRHRRPLVSLMCAAFRACPDDAMPAGRRHEQRQTGCGIRCAGIQPR